MTMKKGSILIMVRITFLDMIHCRHERNFFMSTQNYLYRRRVRLRFKFKCRIINSKINMFHYNLPDPKK